MCTAPTASTNNPHIHNMFYSYSVELVNYRGNYIFFGRKHPLEISHCIHVQRKSFSQKPCINQRAGPEKRFTNRNHTRILTPDCTKRNRIRVANISMKLNQTDGKNKYISGIKNLGEERGAEVWRGTVCGLISTTLPVRWSVLLQRLVTGLQDRTATFFFRYCFQAAVYALWHERNIRRVGEAPQSPTRLIICLDKLIRNRISSLRRKLGSKHEKAMEM